MRARVEKRSLLGWNKSNAMGRIKGESYKAEASAKTVLLYVQHRVGKRKVNEVINVDDLDGDSGMHGAVSLELFEIEL